MYTASSWFIAPWAHSFIVIELNFNSIHFTGLTYTQPDHEDIHSKKLLCTINTLPICKEILNWISHSGVLAHWMASVTNFLSNFQVAQFETHPKQNIIIINLQWTNVCEYWRIKNEKYIEQIIQCHRMYSFVVIVELDINSFKFNGDQDGRASGRIQSIYEQYQRSLN